VVTLNNTADINNMNFPHLRLVGLNTLLSSDNTNINLLGDSINTIKENIQKPS